MANPLLDNEENSSLVDQTIEQADKLSSQELDLASQPNPFPKEPPARYTPQIAAEMGMIAAITMGVPEDANAIRQAFVDNGRVAEYEAHVNRYMNTEDNELVRKSILETVRSRAEELGASMTGAVEQTDVIDLTEATQSRFKVAKALREGRPITDKQRAYVNTLLESTTPYGAMSSAEVQVRMDAAENKQKLLEDQAEFAENTVQAWNKWGAQQSDDPYTVGKGFLKEIQPGTYLALHHYIADGLGIDITSSNPLLAGLKNLGPGSIVKHIQEQLNELDPKERAERISRFLNMIADDRDLPIYLSGYQIFEGMSWIVTPEFLQNGDTVGTFEVILGNVISALDFLAVGMTAKKLGRAAGAAFDTVKRTQPAQARKMLQLEFKNRAEGVDEVGPLSKFTDAQLQESQMPKPWGPKGSMYDKVDDIPDALIPVRMEGESVANSVAKLVGRARENIYSQIDTESVFQTLMRDAQAVSGPALRVALSSMRITKDSLGVEMRNVYGEYGGSIGHPTLEDALDFAMDIDHTGDSLRILKLNPKTNDLDVFFESVATKAALSRGSIEGIQISARAKWLTDLRTKTTKLKKKIDSGKLEGEDLKAAQRELDDLHKDIKDAENYVGSKGQYFIESTQRHEFHPTNKYLFGEENPVVHGGLVARHLLVPTAQFNENLVGPYMRAFGYENAMVEELHAFYAPVLKLGYKSKQKLNAIGEYAAEIGELEERPLTFRELVDSFNPSAVEIESYYRMRQTFDTMHDLQNYKLYVDREPRGFKTASMTSGPSGPKYDGRPLKSGEAKRNKLFYDPVTQKSKQLDSKAIDDLYKRNGSIIEMDSVIHTGKHQANRSVIIDPDAGWRLGPLRHNQLKYVEGYFPRILDHPFIIRMTDKRITVDGRAATDVRDTQMVVRVVDSKKAGERYVNRFNRRARASGRDNIKLELVNTADFGAKELSSIDADLMRTQGRLFFEDRSKLRPKTLDGQTADVVAPIEMMARATNAIAKQSATEELIRAFKTEFRTRYGSLEIHDFDKLLQRPADMATALKVARQSAETNVAKRKLAAEAQAMWDYISLMEGAVSGPARSARLQAIHGAEHLDNILFKAADKAGLGLQPSAKWLHKAAANSSPVETAKRVAFFDYLTTRPLRQLMLQGMQHTFLANLDRSYVMTGRWWRDTTLLLRLTGFKHLKHADPAGWEMALKRNAKLLKMETKEFETLIDNFNSSGLLPEVSVTTLGAGTRTLGKARSTRTAATVGAVGKPFEYARRYGFDLGEKFNVTASYMLALRLRMKEMGYKTVSQMRKEDWRVLDSKGSEFALAMTRPNSAKWQYGWASLPLQFLSFTHKVFLTMMRGIPGIGKYGNRSFTPEQARSILYGQLFLFGGSSFGLRPEFEKAMVAAGFEKYLGTEVVEYLAGGMVDWVLDKAFQNITGNAELDMAFGDFLAPGGNIVNIGRGIIDAAIKGRNWEVFTGPVGATGSRFAMHWNFAQRAFQDQNLDSDEKLVKVLEFVAGGFMSGASDYTKARLMAQTGRRVSLYTGKVSDIDASWSEIIMKGLVGLNPQHAAEVYYDINNLDEKAKDIEQTGRAFYKEMRAYMIATADGKRGGDEELTRFLDGLNLFISGHDPKERREIYEVVLREYIADDDSPNSFAERLSQYLMKGVGVDDYMVYRIQTSEAIKPEEKAPMIEMIQDMQRLKTLDEGVPEQQLEEQIEKSKKR